MAETTCPSCGKKLGGLPEGKRVLVTCPAAKGGCSIKFYYPKAELSVIALRCSSDGKSFVARFKREGKSAKFRVERMEEAKGKGEGDGASGGQFNADVYDWSDFYCPCCGYVETENHGSIVQCNKCHSNVCGGSSYIKPGTDELWFSCHPSCGNVGQITRRIEEFTATRSAKAEIAPAGHLGDDTPKIRLGKP